MIRDVDEMLATLLSAELGKVPGCPVADKSQITFAAPAEEDKPGEKDKSAGKPRLNLYLHDVRENRALRESGFRITRKPGEDTVGLRRAPVNLDLSYLLTAHAGGDAAAEHGLLSDALTVLLRFQDVPAAYLGGALPESGVALAVAQPEHPSNADPAALWQALGGRHRAALSLVVTAEYNPYETKWTRVVRELVVGIGPGTPPHGPQRPLDMSSIRVSAAGVVLDQAQEKPLPGVFVTVSGGEQSAVTDARGFFSLLNLPPGPQTLCFRRAGYQSQEVETVAPPAGHPEQLQPCVVGLRALGDTDRAAEVAVFAAAALNAPGMAEAGRVYHASLSGLLRREDGRPAAYLPVSAGGKETMTDGDGVYCFFDLPPGSHTVHADLPGSKKEEKKEEKEKPAAKR